jgi:ferredoxin-type protein NapH
MTTPLLRHRWLIARRLTQALVLALFLIGPLTGWWLVKGTLASSLTLGTLPLTDPFILLQSLLAGHRPQAAALAGAAIVAACYALAHGRAYCAWVCPLNAVTDGAGWLRRRLGLTDRPLRLSRQTRLWVLMGCLLASGLTGTIAWEAVNPITAIYRGLIFGALSTAGLAMGAVFLIDLAAGERSWCGHLCPVGAFYGLLGRFSLLGLAAPRREDCDDCGRCYRVCPEPHVLPPVLGKTGLAFDRALASSDCTACGRCIDVCPQAVFDFGLRRKPSGK